LAETFDDPVKTLIVRAKVTRNARSHLHHCCSAKSAAPASQASQMYLSEKISCARTHDKPWV
jgi:hypothetical protein